MNLVCEANWLPSFCTTHFYVGSLFGNLLFGWIADKYIVTAHLMFISSPAHQ